MTRGKSLCNKCKITKATLNPAIAEESALHDLLPSYNFTCSRKSRSRAISAVVVNDRNFYQHSQKKRKDYAHIALCSLPMQLMEMERNSAQARIHAYNAQ